VPEVRALLSVLTVKVQESTEELKAQHVDIALHGLKGMTSEVPEVRAMLSALTAKTREGRKELKAQRIGWRSAGYLK
jgi:hypothetical protein